MALIIFDFQTVVEISVVYFSLLLFSFPSMFYILHYSFLKCNLADYRLEAFRFYGLACVSPNNVNILIFFCIYCEIRFPNLSKGTKFKLFGDKLV